jgi:hypothetical protein
MMVFTRLGLVLLQIVYQEALLRLIFQYGHSRGPMLGLKIGGITVFGGGLALCVLVGGLGLNGDSS